MTLWVCGKDGVRYSIGAPRCPQCGTPASQGHEQTEADDMPKINSQGEPTYREAELAGEEGPWSKDQDGTDSSPSNERPESNERPTPADDPSRALGTENRSGTTDAEDSSARSTDGETATRSDRNEPARSTGTKATGAAARGSARPK